MDDSPQLLDRVAVTTGHRDRDETELSLVQLLQRILQADSVMLFKLSRDGGAARAMHCFEVTGRQDGSVGIARGSKAARAICLGGRPAWRLCAETREPQVNPAASGGFETLFAVPGENGDAAGLLVVQSRSAPEPRELQLVHGVLNIVRNHLALIDYGGLDTLTGLLNRKTFETQFDKVRRDLAEERRARRGNSSWIGMVDVDRFKSINDRYGHVFGDEVLLLVSQIIQRSFRINDRVYRFGGEEFLILMQHTPEQATCGALERLRSAIERHRFPQVGTVTVSVGWTRIRQHDAPTDAIGRADMALYLAKDSGRNRVLQFEKLLAEGRLKGSASQLDSEIELF